MEILVAVVGSVAGKFAEYTLEPINRQFSYLISYKSNVQSLSKEVKKLDDQINEVQQLVDAEGRNLRDPMPVVQIWLEEARQTSEVVGQFLSTKAARVGNGRFPDLKLRYSAGRKAKKKTQIVVQLIQRGNFRANEIAGPVAPVNARRMTQGFQVFESREFIMGKVMEALKDDSITTICICRPGGVGKTAMMYQIMNQAVEQKLFDEVVMAIVSQTPDPKKIRDVVTDQLGLKLDQQSVQGRAAQLCVRIERINRFLLVLDDEWNETPFADIGIPLGSVYKILITSRRKDMLLSSGGTMRKPINFEVPILLDEEAWSLFKGMAGDCCEAPKILPIAKQILYECGGLPIAIVSVGSTIQRARSNEAEWRDALQKLKRETHGGKRANEAEDGA